MLHLAVFVEQIIIIVHVHRIGNALDETHIIIQCIVHRIVGDIVGEGNPGERIGIDIIITVDLIGAEHTDDALTQIGHLPLQSGNGQAFVKPTQNRVFGGKRLDPFSLGIDKSQLQRDTVIAFHSFHDHHISVTEHILAIMLRQNDLCAIRIGRIKQHLPLRHGAENVIIIVDLHQHSVVINTGHVGFGFIHLKGDKSARIDTKPLGGVEAV